MAINSINMYISKKNLLDNIFFLEKKYNQKVLPVIKANAYGHGVDLISKILFYNGNRTFAVARLDEALYLLKNHIFKNNVSILIFESVGTEFLHQIKKNQELILSVNCLKELYESIEFGIPPSQISIKIDFGFGRNGILFKEIEILKNFIEEKDLFFDSIYSHLFSATYETGYEIIKNFQATINHLGKNRFKNIHVQNSIGTIQFGRLKYTTHLRIGTLIYGLQEKGAFEKNLKPVFSLKGKIDSIKNVVNSNYLAYELKTNLKIKSYHYIAKIKIGYGDGFLKINEGSTCIIKNKKYKISLVTMDNTFIEVDSTIKVGDSISLYPDLDLAKSETHSNIYELLILLNSRIKRILV